MHRRDFLSTAVLIPGLAAGTRDQNPRPPVSLGLKLGTVTYNIAKDWGVAPLIRNLTEAGFEAVELRTTHRHGVEIALSPAARAEVRTSGSCAIRSDRFTCGTCSSKTTRGDG